MALIYWKELRTRYAKISKYLSSKNSFNASAISGTFEFLQTINTCLIFLQARHLEGRTSPGYILLPMLLSCLPVVNHYQFIETPMLHSSPYLPHAPTPVAGICREVSNILVQPHPNSLFTFCVEIDPADLPFNLIEADIIETLEARATYCPYSMIRY